MSRTLNQKLADRMRAAREDEGGFTLIELLIVIVILGVLAAVVVFSVSGITDRGDTAACKTNVTTARTAVEAYRAKNGTWPATLGDLKPDFLRSDPSAESDAKIKVTYTAGNGEVKGGTSCPDA